MVDTLHFKFDTKLIYNGSVVNEFIKHLWYSTCWWQII